MCNKCQNIHSNLCPNHQKYIINLISNEIQNIFTGLCKEENHPNKLDYFCKKHNKQIAYVKLMEKEMGIIKIVIFVLLKI